MSLVGTRPPTVDEWDKYELHHRARLATKPGLTGMWQVSGRSNITDFEEVVKLDKQYISEWTITDDLVRDLLKEKCQIEKLYKNTNCCDEVFLQTFIANNNKWFTKLYKSKFDEDCHQGMS